MFDKNFLHNVRRNALRKGLWFRALDRMERGILELTYSRFDEVRSLGLARVIVNILVKLKEASKSPFIKHVEAFGIKKVQYLVEQALKLRCKEAINWRNDRGFIQYIALIDFYNPNRFNWRADL